MGKPDKRFNKLFATQQEHERRITEIAEIVQMIGQKLLEEKRVSKDVEAAVREMFQVPRVSYS